MTAEDLTMPGNEAKLVVHHLNNSRSQRILWLLVRRYRTISYFTSQALIHRFIVFCVS